VGEALALDPGAAVSLAALDPRSALDLEGRGPAEEELRRNVERMAELQYALWAENRRAVLVVLQGVDTSGKDGVIRHVLSGVNPQGVKVHAFGPPTPEERDHDFLWRIHRVVPARGEIGVFNRSHYEDVLVARVQALAPPEVIEQRYAIINEFERLLSPAGGGYVNVLKFFLHISREEQQERLLERLHDPRKNWKFQPGDLDVHESWDAYQRAYEIALSRCSTPWAPWHVIPADRKWVRNALVSRVIARALEAMDPKIPAARSDVQALLARLLATAPGARNG
jgi:PPK2 family polyphosphate:nucleotide phosphotransferase